MTLRTLMQAGPAKANELFTKLAETSGSAVKTRERLFAELKTELETHTDLEEQHLFPVLRKHAETKELVAGAIKDNKELRAALAELDALPKSEESFLARIGDLRKAFRQHARDETKELLPAVQKALSEEQVQGIAEKMETSLAEAEQAKHDQAEEKRAMARQEREQAELRAQQEQAAERERKAAERHTREVALKATEAVVQRAEQAEAQAGQHEAAERERKAVERHTREVALKATEAVVQAGEVASEGARQVTRSATESAQRVMTAAAPLATGMPFWDMWLGMSGLQRSASGRTGDTRSTALDTRNTADQEQVWL